MPIFRRNRLLLATPLSTLFTVELRWRRRPDRRPSRGGGLRRGHGERTVPLEAVSNVHGTWAFNETLSVDVEAPATETCVIGGTAGLTQVGDTCSGTSTETVTCTYDPEDGSDPDVTVVQVTGQIRNGRIDGAGFYHETFHASEACRTSGTLGGTDGWADTAVGTTECLDDEGFYSTGPMSGERR